MQTLNQFRILFIFTFIANGIQYYAKEYVWNEFNVVFEKCYQGFAGKENDQFLKIKSKPNSKMTFHNIQRNVLQYHIFPYLMPIDEAFDEFKKKWFYDIEQIMDVEKESLSLGAYIKTGSNFTMEIESIYGMSLGFKANSTMHINLGVCPTPYWVWAMVYDDRIYEGFSMLRLREKKILVHIQNSTAQVTFQPFYEVDEKIFMKKFEFFYILKDPRHIRTKFKVPKNMRTKIKIIEHCA